MADERESAMVVELPELDAVLDEYRFELDPSRRWGMPAHLTLLYPFVPPADVDHAVLSRLEAVATRVNPFESEFDNFGWFADRVVWLAPSHPGQFKSLILQMMDAFPECHPYGGAFGEVTPHVTIGEGDERDRLRAAVDAIRPQLPLRVSSASPVAGHDGGVATAWQRVRLDLETERLSLRSWMATDTAWHRHLVAERGGAIPTLEADAKVVAGVLAADREHGVVPSVVVRREEGDAIGYCGLVVGRATIDEPELAFELFRMAHGNGYATEAAAAVVSAAADTGRERLWSTVRAWNTPSFRVLTKPGFVRHHSTWDDRGEIVWNLLELR